MAGESVAGPQARNTSTTPRTRSSAGTVVDPPAAVGEDVRQRSGRRSGQARSATRTFPLTNGQVNDDSNGTTAHTLSKLAAKSLALAEDLILL
jgi:hypothetical protein